MTNFYVCDATPGSGKTFAAINHMKDSFKKGNQGKWIYVTPYLDEVERVRSCCPELDFKTPEANSEGGCKYDSILKLLETESNIVTTHALFDRFDANVRKKIQEADYSLVMDEVHQCNEKYYNNKMNISIEGYDLAALFESGWCSIDENNLLVWNVPDYKGAMFADIMQKASAGKLICYLKDKTDNSKDLKDRYYLVENGLPISIFRSFKQVYVLTYMFEAQMQRYYYKYWNIDCVHLFVEGNKPENFHFVEGYHNPQVDGIRFKDLINIIDDTEKVNNLGRDYYMFSNSSYKDGRFDLDRLRKDWNNCCKHKYYGATTSNILCTTWKGYEEELSNSVCKNLTTNSEAEKSKTNWIAFNARATNLYRSRSKLGYLVNVFTHPNVTTFYEKNDIIINENMYALSELIQWLYRSAIRDDKSIELYIPSKRMRTILETWISGHNGVRWSNNIKKWQAYIDTCYTEGGTKVEERVYLGDFDDLDAAIQCRNEKYTQYVNDNDKLAKIRIDKRYYLDFDKPITPVLE